MAIEGREASAISRELDGCAQIVGLMSNDSLIGFDQKRRNASEHGVQKQHPQIRLRSQLSIHWILSTKKSCGSAATHISSAKGCLTPTTVHGPKRSLSGRVASALVRAIVKRRGADSTSLVRHYRKRFGTPAAIAAAYHLVARIRKVHWPVDGEWIGPSDSSRLLVYLHGEAMSRARHRRTGQSRWHSPNC